MDYQSLSSKTVVELRRLAKEYNVKIPAGTTKAVIIDMMLEAERSVQAAKTDVRLRTPAAAEHSEAEAAKPVEALSQKETSVAQDETNRMTIDRRVHPAVRAARPLTQRPAAAQPVRPYQSRQVGRTTAGTLPQKQNPIPQRLQETPRREYAEPRRPYDEVPRREYAENRRPTEEAPVRRDYADYRRMAEENHRREAAENRRMPEDMPRRNYDEQPENFRVKAEPADVMPTGEFSDGAGLLEIQPDGYGFLRAENCLPGSNDIYISNAQIRRFNLRMGDYVVGKTRPQREGDRYGALVYITEINGEPPEKAAGRKPFESLVPWYPTERLRLENAKKPDYSLRLIDMLAPIGKGQRGMIVSQPKAGKTTLLKKVANAIADNNPEVELIVLLIDERPEEVTDMKRSIRGSVIYSTFDEEPENHARVSEMVLEHAQRMVEMGKDVVILLDSITRLARAYNQTITPTGRSLSGGLDPGALNKPKRFFGAARNIENGGSLTIIATALVDTGSRMDDIIYEEFKGTGNMELHLDRKLSDRRIFPAIDMVRSGTRREDLLLSAEELDGALQVRRMFSGGNTQESAEQLIGMMEKTAANAELFQKMKAYAKVYEKDGFSMGGR